MTTPSTEVQYNVVQPSVVVDPTGVLDERFVMNRRLLAHTHAGFAGAIVTALPDDALGRRGCAFRQSRSGPSQRLRCASFLAAVNPVSVMPKLPDMHQIKEKQGNNALLQHHGRMTSSTNPAISC